MLGTIRTGKNEVVVVDIKVCDSVGYGLQFVICWWWYFYFFWGGKYGGGGGILFLSSLSEPGGTASSERRRGLPIHSSCLFSESLVQICR